MTDVAEQQTDSDEARQPSRALTDPELFINRELSWLDFNDRVLQLAEDEHLPVIERVKFLAIFVTNLDEFFQVRVAGVHDQVDARVDARGPDGLTPAEVLQGIHDTVTATGRASRARLQPGDLAGAGRAGRADRHAALSPAPPRRRSRSTSGSRSSRS